MEEKEHRNSRQNTETIPETKYRMLFFRRWANKTAKHLEDYERFLSLAWKVQCQSYIKRMYYKLLEEGTSNLDIACTWRIRIYGFLV